MLCMENFQIILNKPSKYAHTLSFQPPKKNLRCLHINSCQRVPKDQSVFAHTPLHTSLKRVLSEVTVCTWHIHNFQRVKTTLQRLHIQSFQQVPKEP